GLEDEYRRLDQNHLDDLSNQDIAKQAQILAFIRDSQKGPPGKASDEYERFRNQKLNFSDGRLVPLRDLRNSRLELEEEAYEKKASPAEDQDNLRPPGQGAAHGGPNE